MMTNERMRVKIGQLLGWIHEAKTPFERHGLEIMSPLGAWWHPDVSGCSFSPPNYPEDLNACHDFEKGLTEDQGILFRHFLSRNSDGPRATFHTVEAAMCHATAPQRCAAFLAVHGITE